MVEIERVVRRGEGRRAGEVEGRCSLFLAGGRRTGWEARYWSACWGGKRRVERPMESVAQIMDCTWKVGQQLAVMPTSCGVGC
jgi:hypothetical protein